jgi:hypothetical protein
MIKIKINLLFNQYLILKKIGYMWLKSVQRSSIFLWTWLFCGLYVVVVVVVVVVNPCAYGGSFGWFVVGLYTLLTSYF